MSATNAQLRLVDPPAQNAEQTELHPELNRAHVRFIGLGKTYEGQQGPVNALHGIDPVSYTHLTLPTSDLV